MAAKEVSVIVRAYDSVTGPLKDIRSGFSSFAGVIKGIGATIVGSAIGTFLRESVTEGIKAEDSYRRLGVAVKNTGADFQSTRPSIDRVVDSVQKLSNQTDDDLRNALTRLIATTGDVAGSMDNLGLVADVAAERHIDLDAAATLVGKTMNGNLTPLTKAYGVEVKSVAEGMALLHDRTDGYAKTATQGLGGALTNLKIQWGELKKALGLAIIGSDGMEGSTGRLSDALINLQTWIKANEGNIGSFIDKVFSLGEAIGKVGKFIVEHTPNWYTAGKAVGIFGDANEATAEQVEAANASVRTSMQTLGGAFQKGQEAMTTTVMAGSGKRVVLTKEEIATNERLRKDAAAAQEKLLRESHKNLEAIESAANKASLELLSASQRAYEEIVQSAHARMKDMTAADRAKAEVALQQHLNALLLKWAGFDSTLDQAVTKTWKGMGTTIETELLPVFEDFDGILKKHGAVLTDDERKARAGAIAHRDFKESVVEAAYAVANGSDELGQFMEAAGLADEKTRALGAGIGDMAEGIGRIFSGKPGDLFGGILQGLGGITKALGGLFGESESERKLKESLDKNRNRIEELTAEVGDLNINLTGKQLAGTQTALKDFFAGGGATGKGWGDRLGQLLLKQGINMSDLEEVAKTLQIELRPNGHLDPRMLKQLFDAIGAVEPTQFRNDFRGKKQQLEAESSLFNLSPEEKAKRLAGIGAGELSGSTASLIGTLDFSSAAGRNKSMSTIQSLFSQMAGGGLATKDLGGLQPIEFLQLLEDLKDLIESANEAGKGPVSTDDVQDIVSAVTPVVADLAPVTSGLDLLSMIEVNTGDIRDLLEAALPAGEPVQGSGSVIGGFTVTGPLIENLILEGTGGDPEQVGRAVAERVSIEMAVLFRNAQQALGNSSRI